MRKVTAHIPYDPINAWARGCDKCKFGLASDPGILAAFPISEGRAVQAAEGMITFCGCKAGHLYRQHLRRTHSVLSMELRRNVLEHIAIMSVPTVHYDPQPAPAAEVN
jgi:hypothetical protein